MTDETRELTEIERYRLHVEIVNRYVPDDMRQRLRDLRLWHWRQCQKLASQTRPPTDGSPWEMSPQKIELLRDRSSFHLVQVVTLNDFFPEPGDTAERDDALSVAGRYSERSF